MGREVKRVPMDFDWPIGQTWEGFFNPFRHYRSNCPECDGGGYSTEALYFMAQWYGNAPFDPAAYGATPLTPSHPTLVAIARRNVKRDARFGSVEEEVRRLFGHFGRQWGKHLVQADVDALIAAGRLMDFTHTWDRENGWQPIEPAPVVTPDAVNAWAMDGMGHDSLNAHICASERCRREGVPHTCAACNGSGDKWKSNAHRMLAEGWTEIPPPAGDGWQMWETTSEGSPISPVFETPDELARWLANAKAKTFGSSTATYEQWLAMILAGWAPSAVATGGRVMSGVEAISEDAGHA